MRSFFFFSTSIVIGLLAACTSTIEGGSGGATGSTSTSTTATSTTGTSTTGTGGASPCAPPPDPQTFEIGTGELCFERLTAQQVVRVLQGPQGGFHLWLSVGCGDCGAKATIAYGIKDPATNDWYAGTGELKQVVDLAAGDWRQHAGVTDFLPGIVWDPMSSLPKGTHVRLFASILDESMAPVHSAEIEVILGDTEMWSPPCDTGPNCGAPGGLPCCTDGFGDGGK
ncbi:MAG: hypothetical protein ABI193_04025 [Minicystis sp.]